MIIPIPNFVDYTKQQNDFDKMKLHHQKLFKKEYDDFADSLCRFFKKTKLDYGAERDSSLCWFKVYFRINQSMLQVITTARGLLALEVYHDMDPGHPTNGTPQPHGTLIRQWRKFEKFEKEFLKEAEKFTKKK